MLFVSHNMGAIDRALRRGDLLEHGVLKLDGGALETVEHYLRQQTGLDSFERQIDEANRVKIVGGRLAGSDGMNLHRRSVELRIWSNADRRVSLDLRVSEGAGIPVGFGSLGTFTSADLVAVRAGFTKVTVSFPTDFLANGSYALSFDVTIPFREYFDRAERCLSFGHERSTPVGQGYVATQTWGYGSIEIPMSLDQLVNVSKISGPLQVRSGVLRQRLKYWLYGSCPGIAGSFNYFGTRVRFPKGSLGFRAACRARHLRGRQYPAVAESGEAADDLFRYRRQYRVDGRTCSRGLSGGRGRRSSRRRILCPICGARWPRVPSNTAGP